MVDSRNSRQLKLGRFRIFVKLKSLMRIFLILAVFTLETDYPLNNSRQIDNTTKFENGTVLILDEKSA